MCPPRRETRMSTQSTSLFQTILARLSFGAVPVGGVHWFDPKDVAKARERTAGRPQPPEVPDADWSPIGISLSRRR